MPSHTDLLLYVAASVLLLGGHVLRAVRWGLLFQPGQIEGRLGLLFGLALGYAINAVLPWRLGELARIWFVARRESVRGASVAATVVAERMADLFVVSIIAAVLWSRQASSPWPLPILPLALFALILWICFAINRHAKVRGLVWRLASVFNDRIRFTVVDFAWTLSEFVVRGDLLKKRFLLASAAMWVLYLCSYTAFAMAADATFGDMLYAMLGSPLRPAMNQILHGDNMSALALLAFSVSPVVSVLAYGASKQLPVMMRLLNARKRYGWYGRRNTSLNVRNKFKAEGEYEYFLVSLFSGSNSVATTFGLQAIDDATIHKLYSGGSDAITALVEVNGQLVIRKFAIGDAGKKLKSQHDWIVSQQENFPSLVQVVNELQKPESYYYDMPLVVPSNDFYDFIHTTPIKASLQVMREVMAGVDAFHEQHRQLLTADALLAQYLRDKVIGNARQILEFANSIFPQGTFTINGQAYSLKDWDCLIDENWLRGQIKDTWVSRIHGDLTIENIIIDPQSTPNWYIIDPNPINVFDSPLIDWAKQMQSVHLGYEGLNRNFGCVIDGESIQLAFTKSQAYSELHQELERLALSRYGEDGLREIYFHELVNYLRLTPYKMRQDSRKGLCFFACTSVLLQRYLARAS